MACGQTGDYFGVALFCFQSLGKFFQQGTVQRTRSMANVNCFVANLGGEETRVAAGALWGTRRDRCGLPAQFYLQDNISVEAKVLQQEK